MSTIGLTQSTVSIHEHIELVHKSVNAAKDAELADARTQSRARKQAHNLALLRSEQRLVEAHRLEKAIIRALEFVDARDRNGGLRGSSGSSGLPQSL